MAHRRKLSISSLSSVAFGCVKLGVGVTVAAGAVAYAAVQVYRGPASQGDTEKEQTRDDAEVTDPAPPAEDTTHPHTSDTSTDACNDHETETASSHAAAEPTPPDSPLPETPIDMTHAAREEEKTPVRAHTHRRKVSFAPIPETEEAIFVPALAPQEPAALPQQQQDAAPKTNGNGNGAAKKKKKNQKKKKTHAQAGSESQDQNALVAA